MLLAFVSFALVCLNICLPFIQLWTFVQGTVRSTLLVTLLLKFRNEYIKTYGRRSSFACNQNIKEDFPTELEGFPWFERKRNETDPPRKHPHNAEVLSGEDLGTMIISCIKLIILDQSLNEHAVLQVIKLPGHVKSTLYKHTLGINFY